MSNLSTLPKGDSAWLLRKAIERIIDQVSVLETNIGVSTSGNSANTQIIFNDDGTLRGDAGLVYNKTTDALTIAGLVTAGSATITGDLTVRTNKLAVTSTGVGIGTASPTAALDVFGFFGTSTAAAVLRNNSAANNSNIVETQYFASNNNSGLDCIAKFGALNPIATGNNYGQFYWQIANAGSPTTAMTLNSTGLGVGYTPSGSADKLGSAATLGVVATGATADLNFRNSSLTAIQRIRYTDGTGVLTIGSATGTAYPVELGGSTSARSMTLDASGNLLVGTTTAGGNRLNVQTASGDCTTLIKSQAANVNSAIDYVTNYGNHTIRKSGTAVWDYGVINDSSATPAFKVSNASAVGVQLVSGATSWTTLSDETMKDIIEPISNAVAKVGSLRSVIGKFKTDDSSKRRSFLIAQDVQSVLPEAVDVIGENNELGLRYTEVIPLLVAAIKELTAEVNALKKA